MDTFAWSPSAKGCRMSPVDLLYLNFIWVLWVLSKDLQVCSDSNSNIDLLWFLVFSDTLASNNLCQLHETRDNKSGLHVFKRESWGFWDCASQAAFLFESLLVHPAPFDTVWIPQERLQQISTSTEQSWISSWVCEWRKLDCRENYTTGAIKKYLFTICHHTGANVDFEAVLQQKPSLQTVSSLQYDSFRKRILWLWGFACALANGMQ